MPTCRRSTIPSAQQLKTLSDEVDNLTKQLQTQGDKLSDAERASRAKTIDDKKKQLQRDGEDAPNDFQHEMQEMYNGLASKVYDVLSSYAQQQGYTLVLDVAQQQTPVLYAVDSTNITKPIIDAYNVKSGVPAPPAQPAGATPAPAPGAQAPRLPKPAAAQATKISNAASEAPLERGFLLCALNYRSERRIIGYLARLRLKYVLPVQLPLWKKMWITLRQSTKKIPFLPLVNRDGILIGRCNSLFFNQ